MSEKIRKKPFPSAQEDLKAAELFVESPQTLSPSYRLAYMDRDFLVRDELRPIRLQLELMKPEIMFEEHGIEATVVVFGSTRIPDPAIAKKVMDEAFKEVEKDPQDPAAAQKLKIAARLVEKSSYYEEARRLAGIISEHCNNNEMCKIFVITGGGPGIMEAANRGAFEKNAKSIGLNIVLPHEQRPNNYITPELCFQFHYFAIRKMHFLMRARALVAFPGGFGTMDELFETLTLIQTKKIKPIPVLLFGKEFWEKAVGFDFLVEEGVISSEDLNIFQYVETAEEAWEIIKNALIF
ncbi:LOG family protein [Dissulfurimicrobium hydrothermale]|uniref:LOG family protein n=1 Tax=Dissulfurimicrobium hydrothermale TaxID=1750598 RepID=UPI001EDC808C|nr:TIGR00730 family Rossman fold protein [Dissulfurimicrobium hydrothermale]UKL13411.1 TIGR00730 family Rossman fold protein [Dissulfurimicrobium hydrothermale]